MVKRVLGLILIGIMLGIGISYLLMRFDGYSQPEPNSTMEAKESTLHEEPIETSYTFQTHGITITLLNSGKLTKAEFQAFKEEFDYQVDEVLELTEGTLPVRKELKFDITKDAALSNNLVLYFDEKLMADEQFYYFQIVSNIFDQDGNTRGRLTSTGLTGYLAKSLWGRPVHEEYSAYIGFEQAPGMVELLDPYEFSANYFVTFQGNELDNELSLETEAKTFSFISYLIDEYGIKSFMQIYGDTNLPAAIQKTYKKTPEALEKEWIDFLGDKQSLGV